MQTVTDALKQLENPYAELAGGFSSEESLNKLREFSVLLEQAAGRVSVGAPPELIAEVYGYLDITSLDSLDNDAKISDFVKNLLQQKYITSTLRLNPAAVCVFPVFIETVKQLLSAGSVKLAVVESSFPHGQSLLENRVKDINSIIALGADEVDAVVRRGLVLSAEFEKLGHEIASLKAACADKKLKIILNTQEIPQLNNNRLQAIYNLSQLAIRAKADMLKSSTGKEGINANLEDCIVMCRAILDLDEKTGFKAAGGIKTLKSALSYYLLAKLTYAENLSSDNFRIGASSLAGVLQQTYLNPRSDSGSAISAY